jgi:hypothetical protein
MALTGWPDEPPLGPPSALPGRLAELGRRLAARTGEIGHEVRLDPIALLGERAALAGLRRGGRISCGGGTQLLRAGDGWVAVSLTRAADVELLAAWLELDGPVPTSATGLADRATWSVVSDAVATRSVAAVVERGVLVGLPAAELPAAPITPAEPRGRGPFEGLPVAGTSAGRAGGRSLVGARVVDLSSLWAGPLCGRMLADAGATVVKVESTTRPDGARRGPSTFFDLMNAGKANVAVDLATAAGVGALARLVRAADVVIEASRPRALEQLGLIAEDRGDDGPAVWVSITGHGRTGSGRDRVAFGDDAAVAGGLVAWRAGEPCFCADAVADPCSGLVAATAVVDALATGGRWTIDVSMTDVAGWLAGPTLDPGEAVAAPPPRPAPRGRARALGSDNAAFL